MITKSSLVEFLWPVRMKDTEFVPKHWPWVRILWGTWALCLLLGLHGLWERYAMGHLPAGYGSYVPWGLWIGLYFHGVGMSGGVFTIGALGYLLKWPGFQHSKDIRLVIVLSVAAILPAFFGVWLDLGQPMRFGNIFTSPSFTSMMAFNSWMYTAFLLIAALCWFLSYRMDNGWLRPLLCLGLFFSVLFPSQSGAFFGVVDAKGFWHSPLLPMLFLVSALTAGAALLLFVRVLTDAGSLTYMTTEEERREEPLIISRLRWITLVGVFTYFVLEFAEFSILLWNPTGHAPEVRLILWGPYWWVFWLVHILLGGVIPIVLLLSRFRPGWVVGALLVAVCFLSARMNVLIPGQAVGEIRGLQEAFQGDRLSYIYHATRMEYFVGLLLIAMGMAVYVVGRRVNQLAGKIIPELFQSNGKSL